MKRRSDREVDRIAADMWRSAAPGSPYVDITPAVRRFIGSEDRRAAYKKFEAAVRGQQYTVHGPWTIDWFNLGYGAPGTFMDGRD